MAPTWRIRTIEPRDEPAMAAIIRNVMPEFGAIGDGLMLASSHPF